MPQTLELRNRSLHVRSLSHWLPALIATLLLCTSAWTQEPQSGQDASADFMVLLEEAQVSGPSSELLTDGLALLGPALEYQATLDEAEYDFLVTCMPFLQTALLRGNSSQRALANNRFVAYRRLLNREEYYSWALLTDLYLVTELAREGRWEEFSSFIQGSLEFFEGDPDAELGLKGLRLDQLRIEERWDQASALGQELQSLIASREGEEHSSIWLDACCQVYGALGQLEQALGRLGPAWKALSKERDAVHAFAADFPDLAGRSRLTSGSRMVDFLLFTARHEEAIREAGLYLQDASVDPGIRGKFLVQAGMAHAEIQIHEQSQDPQAADLLEQALALPELPQAFQVNAHLTLARIALMTPFDADAKGSRLQSAGQQIAFATSLLDADNRSANVSVPIRELAFLRSLQSRQAQVAGEPRESLELHLAEFDKALDVLIESLDQAPSPVGGVGVLHDGRRRVTLFEYVELCFAVDQPERALRRIMEVQAKGSLAKTLGAEPRGLLDVQRLLVEDGGILVYLPSFSKTTLLVIDRATGVTKHDLAGGRSLRSSVADAYALMGAGQDAAGELRDLGTELLPAKVRSQIATWSHVYLVGADLLNHPPFEELPFGDSTFGREVAGAYLPSLPVGTFLAERASSPVEITPESLALFAGPPVSALVQELWPELYDIDLSEAQIDGLAGALDARVWSGADATKEQLFATFAAGAEGAAQTRVLHLFCHGVFDKRNLILPATLALAGGPDSDGLVSCAEISGQLAAPDLVILAACGAAQGPARRGEDGPGHLGGAFLVAGANTVILAREPIGISATLATTIYFQRRLAEGDSVAEALRYARGRAFSENRQAPLFAYGLAHKARFVPVPNRTPWEIVVTLSVAAAALLGWLLRRTRRRGKPSPTSQAA